MKVHCPNPNHEDLTPSCEVYEDGLFCFVCNRVFPNKGEIKAIPKVKEDLTERLTYINTLPTQLIRGLELPFDNTGYYIVWPDKSYYKCRKFIVTDEQSRYLSPKGHPQPLFTRFKEASKVLFIMEGELNALSLIKTGINADIISPGSAGNFKYPKLRNVLTNLHKYKKIILIADYDKPGAEALLEAKKHLQEFNGFIKLKLVKKDANDVLQEGGLDELKKEYQTYLEMP